MKECPYERIVERLQTEPFWPLPRDLNHDFFVEWLKDRLTEEEARFLEAVPAIPTPLRAIAESAGMSEEEAEKMLNWLIDEKAMVMDYSGAYEQGVEKSEWLYGMAEWIQITEHYLTRNVDLTNPSQRDTDVKLGKWLENIKKSERFRSGRAKHPMRVVPIEASIEDARGIVTLQQVSKIIEESEDICVINCLCRSSSHLVGEPCEHPLEVCIGLNEMARYRLSHVGARRLTKEEAMGIVRDCEARGLIHAVDNVKGQVGVICNCCPCHCIPVSGFAQFAEGRQVQRCARSDFINSVILDRCNGTGICIDECPFKALEMVAGKARVIEERCIGCGLCTSACPTEALSLKVRTPEKMDGFYEDFEEAMMEMSSSS